jgi:hypothetical protein
VTWLPDGNLGCSTCNAKFEYGGPQVIVLQSARAHGWHCFEGLSLELKPMTHHVCPDCMGKVKAVTKPKVGVFDEEIPLFEVKLELQRVADERTAAPKKRRTPPTKKEKFIS